MSNRPSIPLPIKRAVRQRCGFGCVICGFPLYEYEHMEEWALVQRHREEEITLLCRMHHGMKTSGLLPIQEVKDADRNPYNKKNGVSKNILMSYSGRDIVFHMGPTIFEVSNLQDGCSVIPLLVDWQPIVKFTIEQGQLFLNFVAYNENNDEIIRINNNELIYDTTQWDIEWIAQVLTIREASGIILLQLSFEPPSVIRIIKGRIFRNGLEILIAEEYVYLVNNRCFDEGFHIKNMPIGIAIGDPLPVDPFGSAITNIIRLPFDRDESIRHLNRTRNQMKIIRNE